MRWLFALLLALAALGKPEAAAQAAGGLRVSPVVIEMPGERGVGSFRIRNERAAEAAFEIDVLAWTQEGGEDALTPTEALIAAPSVFLIPAGGEQIVRLGVPLEQRDLDREQAYRLVLRELPNGVARPGGFRVLLEMSLPVFVQPQGARGVLSVTRTRDDNGRIALAFANSGSGHVRLAAAQQQTSGQPPPRYVLAGARLLRSAEPGLDSVTLIAAGAGAAAPRTQTFELSDAPVLADLR